MVREKRGCDSGHHGSDQTDSTIQAVVAVAVVVVGGVFVVVES